MAKRSQKRDDIFFKSLELGLGITEAAKASGYSRRVVYQYRDKDELFAERWEDAQQAHIERLEIEADRRASLGVDEPVFFQGRACGKVKKYSDTLLMFRLKALAPEKYRERQEIKHDGELKNSAPVVNLTLNGGD